MIQSAKLEDICIPYRVQGKTGVVGHCAAGATQVSGMTALEMIAALKEGLPMEEMETLRNKLDVPMDQLAGLLGISRATLHRRKTAGRLDASESDRVVRYARLLGRAIEVLETEENARQWLKAEQFGLGGEVPLNFAETELGAREVEDLLGRIDYGVYS